MNPALPSTFELGIGYRYTPSNLGVVNRSSVFRHNHFAYDQYKLGAEYMYNKFFAVRAGFDYAADSDEDYLYGTSFGFGLQLDAGQLKDLRVDYAYTTVDFFDALNTFTFQFGF